MSLLQLDKLGTIIPITNTWYSQFCKWLSTCCPKFILRIKPYWHVIFRRLTVSYPSSISSQTSRVAFIRVRAAINQVNQIPKISALRVAIQWLNRRCYPNLPNHIPQRIQSNIDIDEEIWPNFLLLVQPLGQILVQKLKIKCWGESARPDL